MKQEQVLSAAGCPVKVTVSNGSHRLRVTLGIQTRTDCILHWGVLRRVGDRWHCPPRDWWPAGSVAVDGKAVRTPLAAGAQDERNVSIELDADAAPKNLVFVLHLPKENRWLKNGPNDFVIELPGGGHQPRRPEEALAQWAPAAVVRTVDLDSGERLAAGVEVAADSVRVRLVCDGDAPLQLHWGVAEQFRHEWQLPPEDVRPAGSQVFEAQALRTPFVERDGLRYLELTFPRQADRPVPRGMRFVLFQTDSGEWLKKDGTDVFVPLSEPQGDGRLASGKLRELAEPIVEAEVGKSSWTLMHRFNLCHDLLAGAEDDPAALALLFAWLRYSAIRQLDWQRHYNTKPAELSHAQDRLTQRLAAVWRKHGDGSPGQFWARAMLATLGRGGDGQRVRDEILHIMHRNGLKESKGNFVEEWHQKLHNNTTPDDVVICEAYLAFLRSGGDVKLFYQTLEQGGVSRQRLKSFERPITNDPVFHADRKDALIGEFENFLRILKSLHSGTDLATAVGTARSRLDGGTQQKLDAVLSLRKKKAAARDVVLAIVTARDSLAQQLGRATDDGARRDLLFLDLALDESLRGVIEPLELDKLALDALLALVQPVLGNVRLTTADDELRRTEQHWNRLVTRRQDGADWALHALSVLERLSRWVQTYSVGLHDELQPKAEYLGEAFRVEKWVVPLFSEEFIRGGPVFALSRLLRQLDPILRKAAGLGGWQVISPAEVFGRVQVVDSLHAVQAERYAEPTILLAEAVGGEEEIPEGATAVLTTDRLDLVSHAAVRARNAGVLFATCFDQATWEQLKHLAGKTLAMRSTPAGDLEHQEANAPATAAASHPSRQAASAASAPPAFSKWAVTAEEFTSAIVGGKSNNLNGLRGRLPDWIGLPSSMALPFGVCEQVLNDEANRAVRDKCQALLQTVEQDPANVLAQVRAAFQELIAPTALQGALNDVWQRAGLPGLAWEQTWRCIRHVWASKWNGRAYFSRRARGIPHDSLVMAVLIQQVVEADYAFVIHTANPLTKNRDEIFAEVVLGLGETLVGNYPGRALGFVCRKSDLGLQLVSYPSKSVGLYGKGVIFRSDSNGEDLEGFAGAGLYDSLLAETPEQRTLDYSAERLVWDAPFRDDLLRTIARIGLEVEKAIGSAQDIEGAVSAGRAYVVQTRPQVGLE